MTPFLIFFGVRFNEATRSVYAGVNYVSLEYVDPAVGNASPGEIDEENLNLFLGFRLRLSDTIQLDGQYNFETLSSDLGIARDYDRNRFSLGVSATF